MMTVEILANRIKDAFMNCCCPRDIAKKDDWDAEEINKDFSVYRAGYVDFRILDDHAKSLPALSAKAFVFFLKDYLIYAINNIDSELTDHLVYRLSDLNLSEPYWKERVGFLSVEQLRVINEVLSFIKVSIPEKEEYFNSVVDTAINLWGALQNQRLNKL
jgi:hypothetical protein